MAKIKAPLLVHLAEQDPRINEMYPTYQEELKKAGVRHEIHMYPGHAARLPQQLDAALQRERRRSCPGSAPLRSSRRTWLKALTALAAALPGHCFCPGLSGEAGEDHRAGAAGRRPRSHRPHHRRPAQPRARSVVRDREHRRRRRLDRLPDHGARGAGRLHADGGLRGDARHQPGGAQGAVRPDQGLHPDRDGRRHAQHAGGASVVAGVGPEGLRRLREGARRTR